MSVQTSVVLATARTFLNDDAAANWTDAALIPKLQQAHKQLQIKLRRAAAPVMKNTYIETINAGSLVFATPPTDLVAPIQLFEKAPADAVNLYQLMTESDPLPNVAQGTILTWWAWVEEVVTFIGASANRQVKMLYWRSLPLPAINTDLIGFLNGELYLAPLTAAYAAGSTGSKDEALALIQIADASLNEVILSNRGRAPQAPGASIKP